MALPANSKSTNREDYQHGPHSVGAMPKEYSSGYVSARHSHIRAQLLHATQGVMEVRTEGRCWIVPPGRALWIPPGALHETRMRGQVSLRTLYIRGDSKPIGAPDTSRLVRVSPLLRELVEHACAVPVGDEGAERARLTTALALLELDWSREPGLPGLDARDRRLRRVVDGLEADPASPRDLVGWAGIAGVSARSLARLCQREFGMPFARLRQLVRLRAAIPFLLSGQPVTTVALDVGYETSASFSTAFRRVMGVAPSTYLQQ
ncbi:helix-turn-helix transcriptional regulator [Acidisphaera sp. S103]|uniref:AraC family transcriptional regulator n=1 Tax=Acidisphaera sp. S103 TaxID=1747223 RepID=UPI00131CC246|nr:helix-turn-helix transcriptional regulator [Acidisphaera sp. S103]